MKIKEKLKILYNYYNFTRKVGHTSLLKIGIDNFKDDKIVLVGLNRCCTYINESINNVISLNSLNKLIGKNLPMAIDNDALSIILNESINEIEKLEQEIVKYKMALRIFTNTNDINNVQQLNS